MIWPDPTDVGEVYGPAEDSDLLARAARRDVGPDDLVLDVGTGSGYVAAVAAEEGARVVASDLNPLACRRAREQYGSGTADDAGLADPDRPVEVVVADLVSPFRDGVFDVVTFNPPYLPTDDEDRRGDWMDTALAGGPDGRAVIDRFLAVLPRVLAEEGIGLLLASTLTDVDAVAESAGAEGFSVAAVDEESYPFETLTVLKLI